MTRLSMRESWGSIDLRWELGCFWSRVVPTINRPTCLSTLLGILVGAGRARVPTPNLPLTRVDYYGS
jgi:hypothetical protein